MLAFIIHAPKRDITELQAQVPFARIFPAIMHRNGRIGCLLSHQWCLQEAQAAGAPYVWVMEDDCWLTPEFTLEKWQGHIDYLLASDYDLLVGGSYKLFHPHKVTPELVGGDDYNSSHCVVYKATCYKKMLAFPEHKGHIDRLAGVAGLRPLVTVPYMAVQRPCKSLVCGQETDYLAQFYTHEQELRRILQR